jgi:hypothetical protein
MGVKNRAYDLEINKDWSYRLKMASTYMLPQ